MILRLTAAVSLAAIFVPYANAQTTSGVHGPSVSAEDRSFEYRSAFSPGEDGGMDRFSHRLHYQHSLNDSFRLRGIVSGSNRELGDLEFTHIQGELLWQFVENRDHGWDSGIRFEARLSDGDDSPSRVGINWTNQVGFGDGWRLRGLIQSTVDVGERRRDGATIETRASLTRKLENGVRLGTELFNSYGRTTSLGSFQSQSHRIGPVVSFNLTEDWALAARALVGISDGARDLDFGLWLNRSF